MESMTSAHLELLFSGGLVRLQLCLTLCFHSQLPAGAHESKVLGGNFTMCQV